MDVVEANAYYSLSFASWLRWSHIELTSLDLVQALAWMLRSLEGVDVDCDSNSVYLRIREELNSLGIRFATFSKAVLFCSKLIRRYMGSVVPHNAN